MVDELMVTSNIIIVYFRLYLQYVHWRVGNQIIIPLGYALTEVSFSHITGAA